MTIAPAEHLYGPDGQALARVTPGTVQPARVGDWPPVHTDTTTAVREKHHTPEPAPTPQHDPVAEAEAEAIRLQAEADAKARIIAAEAEADATRTTAEAEAEKQRLANERNAMRLEKDRAAHEEQLALKAAKTAEALAAKEKAERQAAEEAERRQARDAEQERTEAIWKWGARGIYAVGLIIAAPVQFLHFWDPKRPFLVAAPGLLEGFALVLACGAAWAVAHRRDVAPYRVGIMLGAAIAAAINMYGGMSDPRIGFNAGLIGAIASLGGPIVLMAYEHGIAQKADGVPSFRERRAEKKRKDAEDAARKKVLAERKAAADETARLKEEQRKAAEAEQKRKDEDRREGHPDVWAVAEAMRQALGSATVTEQIWGDAWYRVTGSKHVGITPEIEARSKAAQARMKAAAEGGAEGTVGDSLSQIESQKAPRPKKDPDAPDGRRFNGGIPPLRRPGDSQPNSPLARVQASHEQTSRTAPEEH